MKYNSIPCKHENGEVDEFVDVDDFHPLSDFEVGELLKESLCSNNPSSQQVRLNQAIVGCTCPRHIDGQYAETSCFVDSIFIVGLSRGIFREVEVDAICHAVNG